MAKQWRLIAGKYSTTEHMENGDCMDYKWASWIVYSDTKPEFKLISLEGILPAADNQVDSICIEDMEYDYEVENMRDGEYITEAEAVAFAKKHDCLSNAYVLKNKPINDSKDFNESLLMNEMFHMKNTYIWNFKVEEVA
jgi:hypothetical protein